MSQHVVVRLCTVRRGSDRDVEHHIDDLALVVIRDLVVYGVFVRAVILDPGVEACLFETGLESARPFLAAA